MQIMWLVHSWLRLLLLLAVALLSFTPHSFGWGLRWDHNTESDLAGYRIYWGTSSGTYTNTLDIPAGTNSWNGPLVVGNYYTVTAYDNETPSLESGFAPEIHWQGEPAPATNAQIAYNEVPGGITRQGTVQVITDSTMSAQSSAITVDPNANFTVTAFIFWNGVANLTAGTVTLGGVPMTLQAQADSDSPFGKILIYTLLNPPTGSQTLAWDIDGDGTLSEGAHILTTCYSGATGVRGSAVAQGSGTINATPVSDVGDMVFGVCYSYGSTDADLNLDNQIQFYNSAEVLGCQSALCEEPGMVTSTQIQGHGSYTSLAAISIQ